jgi:hypothetical protein
MLASSYAAVCLAQLPVLMQLPLLALGMLASSYAAVYLAQLPVLISCLF